MRLQHSLLVLFHFQPEADHRLSFRDLHEGKKKRIRLVFKLWKWQQNIQEKKIYAAFENIHILFSACHTVVQKLLVVMKLWLA